VFDAVDLHTQPLEGRNSVIKHIVKRAPSIAWELLSDRLTAGGYVRNLSKESHSSFISECVANHKATMEALKNPEPDRWTVPEVDVSDDTAQRRRNVVHDIHRQHAATIITRLRGIDAIPSFPSCQKGFSLTPIGVSPEEIVAVNTSLNVTSVFNTVWMAVYKFRSQLWCVAAHREDSENGVCVFTKPRIARPLLRILSAAHSLGTSRVCFTIHEA
jgi:hypothetical protein